MKLKLLMAGVAVLTLVSCGEETEQSETSLETIDQRLSYIVGSNMGKQFLRDSVEIDIAALQLGIDDAKASKESRLTQEEVQETIAQLRERAMDQQKQQADEIASKNKADGEAYLAENAKKEGVVTTESGLQYKVVASGDGEKPTENDTVSVHYKGTLVDGTEFDSSYTRGEPATFPVTGVIPGWVEALQLMSVGDKWELVIPSDLAYGPGGTGGPIGPNSTLVFEVELLEIVKGEAE